MMEIELPKMHPSQQDMELIDILWRQDVDLGAGREVFDLSYRQKEVELRRQREQEEEKRQQHLREQEKALLAQLQLDEETGEFVPRTSPAEGALTEANTTNRQITQNGAFTAEGDAMSFDECMQLLAETFPLDEPTQPASTCLDPSIPFSTDPVMPPDMAVFTQNPLQPDSLDQAWMELLSLPELQQCLSMQMQETTDMDGFMNSSPSGEVQDTNYSQYLPGMDHLSSGHTEACPSKYINTYDGSFNTLVSPNFSQMSLNGPDVGSKFGPEQFCELFYPEMDIKVNNGLLTSDETNMASQLPEIACDPPVNPMDLHSFSPGNFSSEKSEPLTEFPDSDSGLSLDASPGINSPGKSMHGDESFGFSDSDSEEMDGSPGSAESDYTEIFPLVHHSDGVQVLVSEKFPAEPRQMRLKNAKVEPAEASGHSKPPFTKDKLKKRSEARLSRDEQRAKALKIPFTVDMIINLPVDDFNEMTSKHELNEAQLALIRDIRRRGKNKVAAQNCRKRKLENIVGLEYVLDSLKEEKERLKKEKSERSASLREMKHQLNALYQEVFSMLRDEQGRPFSTNEHSLQHTADGTVFLVPRLKKTLVENN
ncbi:nuclear factor erythroid 2-related factor 2a [Triplophysa rosa]|uniref:Nuclear factor erythroid-derived 2-like 2 n=1 Tax=Triplophysa rosa TaxID=992332 RepID=A0A9W7WV87_TRIRA|nr:nuclear factor erythroid 2-related factor 2a [Triplophysa rosa]KAI7809047.1 Nuclear factor erythroid-derived 2-like 2 [Triplophysa rosa]